MPFEIGSVIRYSRDDRPIRVLACDEFEVLYDSWWPHAQGWGFRSLRRAASYYRIPTQILLDEGELLRVEPLSEEEFAVHRPDLPIRLLRSTEAQWCNQDYSNADALVASLDAPPSDLDLSSDEHVLELPSVALYAVGPRLGVKKTFLIHAQDGKGFTARELYWEANRLQAPFFTHFEEGIGLYRSGFFKKTPMFYTWGALDLARFTDPLPGYQGSRTGTFWEQVES